MSSRCSICRHPQRDSIDVSLRRDGIRSAAREFRISRSALDRHKRHLTLSVQIQTGATSDQSAEAVARPTGTHSPLSELDVLMRHCEQALIQATSTKNLSHVIRALKEIRACLELKVKMEAEKPRSALSGASGPQRHRLGDAEIGIRMLQRICWYTRGFDPLKIWQLKTLHDMVMDLVQSKLPPDEIARQMTLRSSGGRDLSLVERLFGILWGEELQGREGEVAQEIVRRLREGLKEYPSIAERIDHTFAESVAEDTIPQPRVAAYHHVGELAKTVCLNSPYCAPA